MNESKVNGKDKSKEDVKKRNEANVEMAAQGEELRTS